MEFQGQRSRWRGQRNGLPQGSVLSPVLFNIYTNDQPLPVNTRSFLYADDLALASQGEFFEDVEHHLSHALRELDVYYRNNQLRPNPAKTQLCAFHLKHRQARRELNITWRGLRLVNTPHPKYLGVTLDRTLTYKQHCQNTRMKVEARNNILRKITGSKWGSQPPTLRTTALATCYSAAEYASPVWYKSTHAVKVDKALNETCRLITGCLRPTPLVKLYHLAGIAPPDIRREVAANAERTRLVLEKSHPLHGYVPATPRLRSRRSFFKTTTVLQTTPSTARKQMWTSRLESNSTWSHPSESLSPGHEQKWIVWRSLNRLRSGVGRSKTNLQKWHFPVDTIDCECGEPQTMEHLTDCLLCPATCTVEDLLQATPNAIEVACYWSLVV